MARFIAPLNLAPLNLPSMEWGTIDVIVLRSARRVVAYPLKSLRSDLEIARPQSLKTGHWHRPDQRVASFPQRGFGRPNCKPGVRGSNPRRRSKSPQVL